VTPCRAVEHRSNTIIAIKIPDKEWLAGGTALLLVVQAAGDRIAPEQDASDELEKDLGDRDQVVVIENAGHALLPEQPEKIAEAVLGFLTGLE